MTENIPDEFVKVITDFINDIKTTFPEFNPFIKKWWKTLEDFSSIENEEERNNEFLKAHNNNIKFLFKFCQKKYPPRFFDILYQNDNIFTPDSDVDTEFLPYIHFKSIWQADDISPKTRETIWKYLQIINVSILSSIDNKEAFGDSAKLFEAIDETEFKTKLEETLSNMQELFGFVDNIDETEKCFDEDEAVGSGECVNENSENSDKEKTSNHSLPPNIPNAEELHGHILGMLDGKLGKLAKEIAEETSNDLNMEMDNVTDMKDVFNKLIKNPTKLMGLIKKVSDKLDSRIKSGEIKESELISEATDIMNKMKNVPGLGNIQSMLGKMGMGGLGGKGGKLNTSAMEAQLKKNLKTAQMKERMREKSENKSKVSGSNNVNASANNNDTNLQSSLLTDEQLISIFSTGEKVDKTPRVKKETNVVQEKQKQKNKKQK